MPYYNIHTHREDQDRNVVSVYNLSQDEILSGVEPVSPNIYYSVGIHPWDVNNSQVDIDLLKRYITQKNKRIVAIGEIGLDKLAEAPMVDQLELFEKQVELSIVLDLPVVIHCVRAWDELIKVYKKYNPSKPWIIHGFRGGREQAQQLIELGFMLSFGKYYKKDAVEVAFPRSLFLETDDQPLNIIDLYHDVSADLACKEAALQKEINQNVSLMFIF